MPSNARNMIDYTLAKREELPKIDSTSIESSTTKTSATEPTGKRRSTRNAKKVDYKALHNHVNTPFLAMEKTAVSEQIASFDHSEGDIECKILDFESDWWRRSVKRNHSDIKAQTEPE